MKNTIEISGLMILESGWILLSRILELEKIEWCHLLLTIYLVHTWQNKFKFCIWNTPKDRVDIETKI